MATQQHDIEDHETEVVQIERDELTAHAIEAANISQQVATAKRYPRSVDKSLKQALTLATLDEETAGSCFYRLPRGKKSIEGPSARLAEIMAYSWGNLRVDADIVDEDRTHVTAMGTCFDLEKNVAYRVRVKRRITDKNGRRYNEDMIGVTSNAAISIACRNSVFKVVPAALTQRIYLAARKAYVGDAGTVTKKRQAAVEWFEKAGLPERDLYEILEIRGLDDIGEDELIALRGLMTAIKDGDTTVESLLRKTDDSSEKTASLNEELRAAAPAGGDGEHPHEDTDPAASSGEGQWHLGGCPEGYGLWAETIPHGGWYFPARCRGPKEDPAPEDYLVAEGDDAPRKVQKAEAFEMIRLEMIRDQGGLGV